MRPANRNELRIDLLEDAGDALLNEVSAEIGVSYLDATACSPVRPKTLLDFLVLIIASPSHEVRKWGPPGRGIGLAAKSLWIALQEVRHA